jgi:hypothetical protein
VDPEAQAAKEQEFQRLLANKQKAKESRWFASLNRAERIANGLDWRILQALEGNR